MLRAIIIDDERLAIEVLAEDISKFVKDVEVVAICDDSNKAKALIETNKPDIVFLDIEMPGLNGFQLLESFEEIDFFVVFVTAYDKFALRAFEFSAADYLVKPVDKDRLIKTVEIIKEKREKNDIDCKLSVILHNLKIKFSKYPTIAVPNEEGIEFVPVEDIVYLKSDGNYCSIYLKDDEKLYVSKTLKHFANLLDDFGFIRTHQSYYVNIRYIRKYIKNDGGKIILFNKKSIPVSRTYKNSIVSNIQKY